MSDSVDRHVALWSRELEWLDPVKEAIFLRMAIIGRHTSQHRRDTLDSGGLARGQFKILMRLRGLGEPYTTSPSHLAELVGLTRGALSARLAPLEEAGLIERTSGTEDRRRVHVRLTAAGHAAFERQVGDEEHDETALLSVLSPEERETLAGLLRKLVTEVEAREATPGPGACPRVP